MKYYVTLILFLGLGVNTNAQFQLNGDAISIGASSFQLTPNQAWKNGSVWYQVKHNLDNTFSVSGQLYFGTNDAGADGIVFVFQDNCLVAGTSGGGMGYENMAGNSLGIEFDIYQNGVNSDPAADHLAIHKMGNTNHTHANNLAGPVQLHNTKANVEDGNWYDYTIIYDPVLTLLEVYFDGNLRLSHSIDLKNSIFGGNPYVYWGFVSATGGLSADHKVSIGTGSTLSIKDDTICSGSTTVTLPPLSPENIAIGGTSNSSSNIGGGAGPPDSDFAFDGNFATNWISQPSDPQWISIDLGGFKDINGVVLDWDADYGSEYKIQTSTNNSTWTDLFHETAGNGGTDNILQTASNVRYVRMLGLQRSGGSGYSLQEFQVLSAPKYAWTPNDGSIDDTTSATPVFTPQNTTTYSVQIPDACLGTVSFQYTVVVESNIDASFSKIGPFCLGDPPVTMNPVNQGTFGGPGVNGNTFDPSIGPGKHLVKHWFTDTAGCTDTAYQEVRVNNLPNAELGPDSSVCENLNYTLDVGALGNTYLWNDGSTNSSLAIQASGMYWVSVTDTAGCSNSDTVNLTLTPAPIFELGNDTNVCEGELLVLGPRIFGDKYLWNTGDSTRELTVYNKSGNYVLTIIENNCPHSDSLWVDYTFFPQVLLPEDTTICESSSFEILPLFNHQERIRWHNGSTSSAYLAIEEEEISISAYNSCGSTTDTMYVETTNCDCNIYLPTAFSPNSDGSNDFYQIQAYCGELLEFRLQIFNSWGELVFESSDVTQSWNGDYKNIEAPMGVYATWLVYTAQLDNIPSTFEQHGHLTLIR